jgi:hypothetical protein
MYKLALLFGLIFLSGCSTHPITGRDQILPLPALQAAYADVDYAFSAVARSIVVAQACAQDCTNAGGAAIFVDRVKVIGAQLDASARDTSPKLFERAVKFRIEVSNALGIGTASSAGGRIALGAGLATLEPSDTVITFLIAREMAHVIARHAEENSGASMVFSALGMLVPGVNVLLRFAATTMGSGALRGSWAMQQQREADEIAVALLERTGLTAGAVARSLEREVKHARLPADGWGARYLESTQRVAQTAAASLYAARVDD